MSSTSTFSSSPKLVGVEITTKRTNTDDTTNTLDSLYKCDDAEPQTVSEEENSSPPGIEDNDNDNLIIAMTSVENENLNIPDDHTNTAELQFLESEEEKLMKYDEDLIISKGAESVIQSSTSTNGNGNVSNSTPKTNLQTPPQQELQQDVFTRTCDPQNHMNQESENIQKQGDKIPMNLDIQTGQIPEADQEIGVVKNEVILSNNDAVVLDNSENMVSPSKSTKRVKINESSIATEHNEFTLKRSRMDSIDLDCKCQEYIQGSF